MFDRKKFDAVCIDMSNGLSNRQACMKNDILPSTFREWMNHCKDETLKQILLEQYARAREDLYEYLEDQILERAKERPERIQTQDGDRIDPASVSDKTASIAPIQWLLGKVSKRHSDRQAIQLEHSGKVSVAVDFSERPE